MASQIYPPSDSNLVEVPVFGLRPGMFVAELDRPWLETPFATQGFVVGDQDDVDYIAKHCAYVYIDPKQAVRAESLSAKRFQAVEGDRVGIKQEISRAQVDFESASLAMERVFTQIVGNRRVNVAAIKAAIDPLIDSVMRNREALAALIRMKKKGGYLYQHSLSTAVWAAILGRHLGLERDDLCELALGASMMDVGMSSIPDTVLNKRTHLSDAERQSIRGHVKLSLKLVKASGDVSKKVLNLIACHHERADGSGYPRGLKCNETPLFAQIAGLVDTYDAMITERPHAPARSSFEAVQELSDMQGGLFHGALVEQFVQTIGMFPTGSIVELNTGEVGVVVKQNSTRRLRPKLVLIMDEQKQRRAQLRVIDLSRYVNVEEGTPTLWIARELESGAYGIKSDEYFL